MALKDGFWTVRILGVQWTVHPVQTLPRVQTLPSIQRTVKNLQLVNRSTSSFTDRGMCVILRTEPLATVRSTSSFTYRGIAGYPSYKGHRPHCALPPVQRKGKKINGTRRTEKQTHSRVYEFLRAPEGRVFFSPSNFKPTESKSRASVETDARQKASSGARTPLARVYARLSCSKNSFAREMHRCRSLSRERHMTDPDFFVCRESRGYFVYPAVEGRLRRSQ